HRGGQPGAKPGPRHGFQLGDVPAGDQPASRLGAQARAAAAVALRVTAIARHQDAVVHLVAFLLEVAEPAADAGVLAEALDHHLAVRLSQLAPRDVERHLETALARVFLQPLLPLAEFFGAPRRDGATFQGQPLVGNDFFEIHARGAAEALARLARAERRVVRKQSRLRRTQLAAADIAAHALAEFQRARASFEKDLDDAAAEAPRGG